MLRRETAHVGIQSWLTEHRSWIAKLCLAAGSALGILLLGLSTLESAHGVPRWLTVLDPAWALIAFAGVATFRGAQLLAVGVWGFLGFALGAVWLLGLGAGAPAGLVALHIAIALCFVALALAGAAAQDPEHAL